MKEGNKVNRKIEILNLNKDRPALPDPDLCIDKEAGDRMRIKNMLRGIEMTEENFEKIVSVVDFEEDLQEVMKKHGLKVVLYRYDKEKWGVGVGHKFTIIVKKKVD